MYSSYSLNLFSKTFAKVAYQKGFDKKQVIKKQERFKPIQGLLDLLNKKMKR
jgi:hypothetical protein